VSERDETMRAWRLGEERLYPVVMTRPDLYQRCIELVRSLVDSLAPIPDLDALVATWRVGDARSDLERAGVDPDGLPVEIDRGLIRDAAYQQRARELEVRAPVEDALRSIRRARSAGEPVVTLWHTGTDELRPPWRRVEMAVSSGRAVVLQTELDPDRMEPLFALEAVQLDPDTGTGVGEEPLSPRREFTDPDLWRAAADQLRAATLTPDS
jgi:hypothetical protein